MGFKSAKKEFKDTVNSCSISQFYKVSNLFGKVMWSILFPFLCMFWIAGVLVGCIIFLAELGIKED